MKIKTLSRSEEAFTRECKGDVVKVFRNLEPALHPFDKAREYTRALTATKLDKMFAKPLVGACVVVGWGSGYYMTLWKRYGNACMRGARVPQIGCKIKGHATANGALRQGRCPVRSVSIKAYDNDKIAAYNFPSPNLHSLFFFRRPGRAYGRCLLLGSKQKELGPVPHWSL